jgi:AmmeMemoRadiSam system protein A
MLSAEPQRLDAADRRTLLALARASIAHGLAHASPLKVDPGDYGPALREERAVFVTLTQGGSLRGCIGHLEAVQPLAQDVAENAFQAAFRDPRFPPVQEDDLPTLKVQVSVLSPPEPMPFDSEEDLLSRIEPGRDGLILRAGKARGTFLPSVWESLPEPREFLRHLKMKAGLRPDFWSEGVEIWHYHTESFSD